MMTSMPATRRMFMDGQLVELWELPGAPFGCTPADLQAFVDREDWVLLFNALVLLGGSPRGHLGA